jgi:N-acetyl-anhydromuramyl-L-alanine amidase AmpD
MALDINKIIQKNLSPDKYYAEDTAKLKKQIFVHHTAGGANPFNVINSWQNRIDKVATAFIIAGKPDNSKSYKEGDIVQAFSSKNWAWHLGLSAQQFNKVGVGYQNLDKMSIGIEICNFGQLTLGADGKFRTYVNSVIPKEDVITLDADFRGYKYFHAYTDAQLASVKDLIVYLCEKYNIPKAFNENMFEVNKDCMGAKSGIWTHTSCRQDKWDCPPQPKLIEMLKSL